MPRGRLEVTGGFLLLAALLYYLEDPFVFLLWALSCALHELGHYAAIRFLGGRVARLRLSACGAEMTLSAARPLAPPAQLLAALAGPAVNLACAALFAGRGQGGDLFAGIHLALALFNLLPARQLDGGRALFFLLNLLAGPLLASRVSALLTAVTGGGLLLLGLWCLINGGVFTLLLLGLWLCVGLVRSP